MLLGWSDSTDIAIELADLYPQHDPKQVRFTELRKMILALENFDDDPDHCGERVLEAVMLAWIDEY
ncbi:MAG: FeS assembly protein IscX [Moritella sp.]|jgi:FeS assembly protein IscX